MRMNELVTKNENTSRIAIKVVNLLATEGVLVKEVNDIVREVVSIVNSHIEQLNTQELNKPIRPANEHSSLPGAYH